MEKEPMLSEIKDVLFNAKILRLIKEQNKLFGEAMAECNNKTMNYETCKMLEEMFHAAMVNVLSTTIEVYQKK